MENKIEYSKPVPPFVKFCAANIPMVFDDSLSYYEALCALWKWLQTDVIDVINNNAAVTQTWREELTTFENNITGNFNELSGKFDELKNFVDTYFDNLDVQEEINHKLDEMVEDGTFDTLLANYLVICGGNAKQLGCAGDGVTDDTEAIQDAIDNLKALGVNKLVFPSGNYVISGTIEIPSNFELVGMKDSVLKYVGNGTSGNLIEVIGEDADNPIENVTITNINIDGTNQVYKGGIDMDHPTQTDTNPMYRGLVCVQVTFGNNITIQNCNFTDIYGEGIRLGACFNCHIDNNTLQDVSSGNITPDGQTGYDNHGDALASFRSYNVTFSNNTIVNTRVYLASTDKPSAIGKPCGRSGMEFEYPTNQDYTNNNPDDVDHNAPYYSLIPTSTIGDKEYRYEYGNIMDNNYVYGYTKGIHIESQVKCKLVNNTILKCHIGIMFSTEGGCTIDGNYFNTFNVGAAPQSGYDAYYGGVALSSYGADDTKYGLLVSNNIFEGEGKAITVGCSKVTINGNQFRSEYGVYTVVNNLSDIVVSNNTFNDKFIGTPNAKIYLYQVKSAIVDGNSFYCKTGFTDNIRGDNFTITNNTFENYTLNHDSGGRNLVIKDNIFKGMNTTSGYSLRLSNPTDSEIDGNTFYADESDYNDKNIIKTYGAVTRTSFTNNRFYVSNTRGDKKIIESDNITYCRFVNNICEGGTDSIRFICSYTCRQCTYIENKITNDLGQVINTSGFRGWNIVEKNTGVIHSGGYYPNDSLGELVNLYYSKSEKFYKFNINSSSTNIGWVCVSGGYYVTDTWSSTSYTANKMLKNSNGNVYKCITAGSGASSVEPTQTSGTQAETDGYTWKYLGAVAVFKDLSI